MNLKKGAMILAAILLVVVACSVVLLCNEFTIEIAFAQGETLQVEAGEEFAPTGVKAYLSGKILCREPVEIEIDVSGAVDMQTPGSYSVTYTAKKLWLKETKTQTVIVRDTKAPVITLVTNPEYSTLPGTEYVEEGYTAVDALDGDVTDAVVVRQEDGKVIYTVSDAAGNTAQVQREILYEDKVPPVITLKGDATVTIYADGGYKEPGWTATDNGVTDLSAKVTVTGLTNFWTQGTYQLTYSVTDDYGNTGTAVRTVVVKASKGTGKVIYLTFDDGPSAHTERLLGILKKYNVKASFFLVNTEYISLSKQIAADGHTIGLHANSHTYSKIYASDAAFKADHQAISNAVAKYTGQVSKIMRFPGGTSNTVSKSYSKGIMTRLNSYYKGLGYRIFDWNVSSGDGVAQPADKVYQNVVNGCKNKSSAVVLMHDTQGQSVDAVERIIIWGLSNGFTFLPLTQNSPACQHGISN